MRVLLICLDNLGDLVFTSSLVKPLLNEHPSAEWMILCKDYAADIARCFPCDPTVVAADPWWDGSPGRSRGSFSEFLKAVSQCRKWKPDVVLVASNNWRAAAVARAVRGKVRIGFANSKSRYFLTESVSVENFASTPITSSLQLLLRPLGVQVQGHKSYSADESIDVKLLPSTCINAPVENTLNENFPKTKFVMLHPFAGDRKRCWSIDNWIEFSRKIKELGYEVMWMGRKDEIEDLLQIPQVQSDLFLYKYNQDRLINSLAATSLASAHVGMILDLYILHQL